MKTSNFGQVTTDGPYCNITNAPSRGKWSYQAVYSFTITKRKSDGIHIWIKGSMLGYPHTKNAKCLDAELEQMGEDYEIVTTAKYNQPVSYYIG